MVMAIGSAAAVVAFLALATAVAVAFLTAPAAAVAFLLAPIMGSAVAFLAGWAAARPVGSRDNRGEAVKQKGGP